MHALTLLPGITVGYSHHVSQLALVAPHEPPRRLGRRSGDHPACRVIGGPRPPVGAERAHTVVAAALDRMADGPVHVLAVTGEPGTGKSRLLAEAGRLAAQRGLAVLSGQVPFRGRGAGGSSAAAHDGAGTETSTGTDSGTGADTGAARVGSGATPEMMWSALEALGVPGLVVLVDDVHRADDGLIDVLLELLQRPPRTTALVVLAYTPRLVAARLHRAVTDGGWPCPVEWLPLPPLQVSAAAAAAAPPSAPSGPPSPPTPEPLYLRALLESAGAPGAAAPGEDPPAGPATALSAAFAALPARVRAVGRAAAVVGESLEIELVAATADVGQPEAVAAVDELVRRGLLRPVAGTGRFAFRDRGVWRAAYDDADPAWRVAAHARAAAALRGRGAGATALAPHLELAAASGDLAAISELEAAARAARVSAPAVSARWLRAAIRLAPQQAGGAARRTRLLVELADVLADAGRLAEARDLLHRALESVERDAPELCGFLTARCAQVERLLCHGEEGRALLLRAVSARPANDEEVLGYAFELALAALVEGELEESRRWAGVALAKADRRRSRALKAAVLGLAGLVESLGEDIAGAAELVDASARLVDGLTDSEVRRLPQAAGLLARGELLLGRRAEALRHLDRGISAARASGNALVLPELLVGRSLVLRQVGRLGEAADAALAAVELATASGSDQQLVPALAARCVAATWLGDQKVAMHAGAASTTRRERPAGRWVLALAHRAHAEALLAAGHAGVGADLVGALGGPALTESDPWSRLEVYELLTRAALAAGDLEAAQEWAARAEPAASGLPGRVGIVWLARAQASLIGEPSAASGLALAAAELLDGAGLPLEAARAWLVAGSAAGRVGRIDEAAAQLKRAQEAFERHGARRWSRQAVAERRRLAGGAPRSVVAARSTLTALTRRERQVAELVSRGLSNRRVAQQLYVAEKTVEMHLSHIFVKLGVASRTEMTRVVMAD